MKKLASVVLVIASLGAAFGAPLVWADAAGSPAPATTKSAPPTAAVPAPSATSDRTTSLSFDNAVVEGMNANSMDSAENVDANDGMAQHLYHVRTNYNDQTPMLIHEMGFSE